MKQERISLVDGKGGLNDHVLGSGIAKNEFSRLQNYYTDEDGSYLVKRSGKELVQYAPIKPTAFVTDGNTLGLWTLDETTSPYADTSGNGLDITGNATAMTGLFSNGQQVQLPVLAGGVWSTGSVLVRSMFPTILDGLGSVCLEAWVNLDPSFSGEPKTGSYGPISAVTMSNDGVPLIATLKGQSFPAILRRIINGISVHRDWDAANNQHASSCYFKFTLNTSGIPGTQTVITGSPVPFNRWLHVRAEYDSVTGLMSLYVNGTLVAQGSPVGGGNVADDGTELVVGGRAYSPGGMGPPLFQALPGIIDEARISNTIRTASAGFPFKNPRGMGFEFAKSDGTRQAVVSADDGLYFTLGDTGWTEIATGFSTTDYWDAVFRKDILYLSDGVDTPKAWDGATLLDWGNPTIAPQVTLGASGAVTNGVHKFAYTYLYGDYETGLSPSASITIAANEEVNVGAIPPRHSNCTAVRLYATKAGANDWFLWRQITNTPGADMEASGTFAAGSPAGYSTDQGAFGVADATLGASSGYPAIAAIVQTSVTPKGKFLLGEHDRIFACGMLDEPYTLRWTELGAPDIWRVLSFVNAAADKGGLSALASFYGEIHASKSGDATLVLRGDNPSNWTVFEKLHSTVGCIDHWGYVHRYLADSDKYVLCFPGRDGFYSYAGQQIRKVSDKIQGTINRLVQNNATRNEWIVTTQAQFRAQLLSGGSASANLNMPSYEDDGIRQIPGHVSMWNQLEYLGLWNSQNPYVTGNVISIAKADAEGAFYFATDASNNLYYTPDNFVTAPTVIGGLPIGADERIIQIVRRGTDDFWFLVTDSAGTDYSIGGTTVCKSSGGGKVYSVEDPLGLSIGPVWQVGADTLYYDLDVPNRMNGNQNNQGGNSIGIPQNGMSANASSLNLFCNHNQSITFARNAFAIFGISSTATISSNANLTGGPIAVLDSRPVGTGAFSQNLATGGAGFFSYGTTNSTMTYLRADYTRREYPRWRGGTFAPQAFWDAANSRLVFLGSGAEDGNGNRTTSIRTLDSSLVLTSYAISGKQVSAIVAVGTDLWMWTLQTNTDGGNQSYTFKGRAERSTLAAPGTIVFTAPTTLDLIGLRLGYSADNTLRFLGLFKSFEDGVSGQDFYTYTGSIRSLLIATGVETGLLALTANADSGPVPVEMALQTTAPAKWFVAVNNLTTAALYSVDPTMDAAADVSVEQTEGYEGENADGPQVGIWSNLLFVQASDAAGNYLWADRLYWQGRAADNDDGRMIQLGVPGIWTVQSAFESEAHNFGTFSAFDSLNSSFSNGGTTNALTYEFRNAADPVSLAAAAYLNQQPNSKIAGFVPVAAYGQWRVDFTWSYDYTVTATTPPYIDFVTVGYFLGNANIPRITGIHWQGRTYWTVAEDGSTYNNVVLVYQKNDTWTKHYGWNMKSMFRFRNQLHGLEAYQLVRLESGQTDMGSLIVGKARTGYIMGWVDKLISGIQANVAAFANNLFANRPGYVKITPYQANSELTDSAWVFELPDSTSAEPRRVQGVPWSGEFRYDWIRAFALEIGTSEDLTGAYVPYVEQPEQIQQVDVMLEVTDDSYDITVR